MGMCSTRKKVGHENQQKGSAFPIGSAQKRKVVSQRSGNISKRLSNVPNRHLTDSTNNERPALLSVPKTGKERSST